MLTSIQILLTSLSRLELEAHKCHPHYGSIYVPWSMSRLSIRINYSSTAVHFLSHSIKWPADISLYTRERSSHIYITHTTCTIRGAPNHHFYHHQFTVTFGEVKVHEFTHNSIATSGLRTNTSLSLWECPWQYPVGLFSFGGSVQYTCSPTSTCATT